jgi:hypothetical protein
MRTTLTVVVCIVVTLLVMGLADSACATSVLALQDEQLVSLSRVILTGRVTAVTSEWNTDNTQIYTTVRIAVADVLKGEHSGDTYTLRLLGGRVGDTVMEVVGAPSFTAGDDVVLFVDRNAQAVVPLVGMSQGKLTITTDPATGARVIDERGESPDRFFRRIRGMVEAQREVER